MAIGLAISLIYPQVYTGDSHLINITLEVPTRKPQETLNRVTDATTPRNGKVGTYDVAEGEASTCEVDEPE